MHSSVPTKTCFPAAGTGEKSWGRQVSPHFSANMHRAAMILSSTAAVSSNQGYTHCLIFSLLGTEPQRQNKTWSDTTDSLANICEGQKTYVPNSLEISASHVLLCCSGLWSSFPLQLKYHITNCHICNVLEQIICQRKKKTISLAATNKR